MTHPIVSPDWVLQHWHDDDLVFVDVRPAEAYAAEHIRGARHASIFYDYFVRNTDPDGIAEMNTHIAQVFSRLGIAARCTAVFYEADTGMAAPRGLWFHEYAGFDRGFLLDGGLKAWKAAGGPVATGPQTTGEAKAAGIKTADIQSMSGVEGQADLHVRPSLMATVTDILRRRSAITILLDTRRESEFRGTFAHPCCSRAGRIEGAVHLFWEEVVENGRYAPPEVIRKKLEGLGITPDNEVITYCHRGGRSATVMYALRLAGYEKVRNYIGSWHEWAERLELPVVKD